jgi:hypothetical protein
MPHKGVASQITREPVTLLDQFQPAGIFLSALEQKGILALNGFSLQ